MSRRGVIAAMAAGAAVNLPVIAMTAAAPVATAHPDHELLDLGRKYDVALVAEDSALERWTAACDAYAAAEPAMPRELRHRPWEHGVWLFPLSPQTRMISDLDTGDFYCADEIDVLRDKPRTRRVGFVVDKATGERWEAVEGTTFNEVTQEKHLRNVPDIDAQARADAIVAAWDRHQEACGALPAYGAFIDAEVAYYAAVRVRQALGETIAAARATTLPGLAVRARIVAGMQGVDDDVDVAEIGGLTIEEKMIAATLRDLTAMARSV